jgi:hypothetical protein
MTWTGVSARQDRDLVPEHQDLRILGGIAPRQEQQPAEHPDHQQVGKRISTSADRRAAGQAHTPDSGTAQAWSAPEAVGFGLC